MPSMQAIVLPTLSRPLEGAPTSPAPPVAEHHLVLAGFTLQRQRVWLEVNAKGCESLADDVGLRSEGDRAMVRRRARAELKGRRVVDRSRVINQIAIFTGDDRDRVRSAALRSR